MMARPSASAARSACNNSDVGGKTSHTAIVARGLDIPAVVGARLSSQLVRQDDWVIVDGDAGVMVVDPSPILLAEYGFKQRQGDLERGRLTRLLHTPAVTMDGQKIELLANIEMPEDAPGAIRAGGARSRRMRCRWSCEAGPSGPWHCYCLRGKRPGRGHLQWNGSKNIAACKD